MQTIPWNGKPIIKAGLYSLIGLDTYHRGEICSGPSVSSSGLRTLFDKSPAHFYDEWPGNPDYVERPDKAHFILGRAAHHLYLREVGVPSFGKLFAVPPKEYPDKQTGEMKAWTYKAAFCQQWKRLQESEGKAVLRADDIDALRGMADALKLNPLIIEGALNGLIERSIFWRDEPTGLWLKSRPDAIPTSGTEFVDLKTTTSVVWTDLQRTISECGYNQQGALIRRAAREVLGIDNPTFHLVFVEKARPFCVEVVTLKDNDLDRGEQQNRLGLDTIARCLKAKRWPGPGGDREDARYIELPEWKQKQIDERLQHGIGT
jgi:hypothetical protein